MSPGKPLEKPELHGSGPVYRLESGRFKPAVCARQKNWCHASALRIMFASLPDLRKGSSMRFIPAAASLLILVSCMTSNSFGDLVWGPISNFQDGTVQGWAGGTVVNVANSGPLGAGDHSLRLSNGGVASRFAMFNTGVNGAIHAAVTEIVSDILRPPGEGSAEIRLVMFDTAGTRWTSTVAANVIDNGLWNRYSFSVLEADLTRVAGTGTYAALSTSLERIMFRYDPGIPTDSGLPLNGSMNFDNIAAVPEPSSACLLAFGVLSMAAGWRRQRAI